MKGFAATVTAKELARALASHRTPEPDRDVEAAAGERFPEVGTGKTNAEVSSPKQEEQR